MFWHTFTYTWGGVEPQAHNFRLNGSNDLIFASQHDIMKMNISWKFGESPTWWRHIMARDVIFS